VLHADLTEMIIASFYRVYNHLGYGFLEKVYENAMMIEFRKQGLQGRQQERIKVYYDGEEVGDYFADILVNDLVIVELKAARTIQADHQAQLTNYLRATDKEVGLLLNFGETPEFKRVIFTNDRKRAPLGDEGKNMEHG